MKSRLTIATPPGATIKEQLDDRGMSQKELALRMAMSEKHISKLINGEVRLTPDVAQRLEYVLGVPAGFWNNLEAIYREKLVRAEEENAMERDQTIAEKTPYKDMAKLGWVEDTRDKAERVRQLRRHFEVARLEALDNLYPYGIACRQLTTSEKTNYALAAWAQQARIDARDIPTKGINLARLEALIPDIRAMTQKDPKIFCPLIVERMAECGIALVFLPHISGSFLHGASFYDGNRIVMGLTVRGKDADKFWFSLFHEIAHVLKGHIGKPEGTSDQDEDDANTFARDTLIPARDFHAFTAAQQFTEASIIHFSQRIGIAPGIVVGRLQKEQLIDFRHFNALKTKYGIRD